MGKLSDELGLQFSIKVFSVQNKFLGHQNFSVMFPFNVWALSKFSSHLEIGREELKFLELLMKLTKSYKNVMNAAFS